MQSDSLNDLLEIYIEGPTMASFSPDLAIELWWSDCSTSRRVNQQPRKAYASRNSDEATDHEQPQSVLALDCWDQWFEN